MILFELCLASFFAGFVDSIVGGGGLIQLPALLAIFPQMSLPFLLGTNKFASFFGTLLAIFRYAKKKIQIPKKIIIVCSVIAFFMSWLGAHFVSKISNNNIKPLVIVVLIAVAVFTLLNKKFGGHQRHHRLTKSRIAKVLLFVAIIGFYDGFLGPGTGGFLIFLFISVLGLEFLGASAAAKWVNAATNLSAVLFFIFTHQVMYSVGLPMAIANMGGNFAGTHIAVRRGNSFVRVLFIIVLVAIFLKLLWDIL